MVTPSWVASTRFLVEVAADDHGYSLVRRPSAHIRADHGDHH
ncbi:hypothetical protein [Catellatospora tritici]|nr:hypothetical protein [Catellatospora tritici]